MDVGLDRTIERLNALKLHVAQSPSPGHDNYSNPPTNQQEGGACEEHQSVVNHEPCARVLQQVQVDHERQLQEQRLLIARMQEEMQELQRRLLASEHQNHLLRNAMGVVDTYKAQVADQQLVIDGLQDQVKQLRMTNYRLQYMVQQNERGSGHGNFLPPSPPDIF